MSKVNNNLEKLQEEVEKKYEKKGKKKKKNMKVSGAGVKGLQRIIGKKAKGGGG